MEFVVNLERMAANGPALGRFQGKVVFVPYGLPGEKVRVKVEKTTRSWMRGLLLEVLQPSGDRRTAPCPHFGIGGCGGCQWQHLESSGQRDWKTRVVKEQFRRLGKLDEIEVLPASEVGPEWGYRNHVQLKSSPQGYGYVAALRGGITVVQECPVMHPGIAAIFGRIQSRTPGKGRLSLRMGVRTGQMIVVSEGDGYPAEREAIEGVYSMVRNVGNNLQPDFGPGYFFEEAAGFRYRISAGSFFQINTPGADALVQTVMDLLPASPGGPILELYSGVGLFTLPLGFRYPAVTAVESHSPSLQDAWYNLKNAGLRNVRVTAQPVERALESIRGDFEAVLLDPPRKGCTPQVLEKLAELRPEKIVYVSCDPATLARDAGRLLEKRYLPVKIQPLDLFPQTYHVETVVLFQPF